ncbi:MAG TPA: LacI family DNA-binding transcriptional regulator, partial [Nakamurella sp.]
LQAVDELQYVPNMMARSFRSGQDTAVGVAVPAVTGFFGHVVEAVERIARDRGVAMYLTCLGHDTAAEQAAIETLLGRNVVGMLIAPIAEDQAYLKPWRERTSMVFLDRRPRKLTAAYVVHDDKGGTRLAVTHLLDHGHRRIAFAGDSPHVPTTSHRRTTYELTLFDGGVAVDPFLVAWEADTHAVVPRLLALSDPPTAIFSANPSCSMSIARQLHAMGRTDVVLVGFGDFPMADTLTPPITVIEQDPTELGTLAANRLFRRIDEPDKRLPRQTVVPVSLIRRGCCERSEVGPAA